MVSFKKFVIKKVILLQFIAFIVFSCLLIFVEFFYIDRSLSDKEYLLKYNFEIVFAGDSRSQRGLNPQIASKLLNINSEKIINLSVDGGDPTMLEHLIKRNKNLFKDKIVILSISANHLNDGVKEIGRFTNSMISNLTYEKKIELFLPKNKDVLINFYLEGIKNIIPIYKKKFVETNGFHPIFTLYDFNKEKHGNLELHPWYKNYNFNGYKYEIIKKSLNNIKQNVKKLYLFVAPYAPTYVSSFSKNDAMIENKFKMAISNLSNDINIKYIYYDDRKLNLKDEDFSDNTHLNNNGALKFTKIVIKDFLSTLYDIK